MKRIILVAAAVLMLFLVCACSGKSDAETVRSWTKKEWTEAANKDKIDALAALIEADRDDIDAQKSAEISVSGFDDFFETLEDETLTLGEIYDSCKVEETVNN